MNAAVFDGPRSVSIQSLAVRKPGPGRVLVRLEGSGICGSDLPLWQGRSRSPYPQPPGSPGHEGWGIISALGPGVDSYNIGDRVSGIFDGAFAEISEVGADRVIGLPRRLDGLRFPGEPLACAVNAFHRSGIRSGDTVAILGIGFVGAIIAQLARRAGARVIAVSRRESGLRVARGAGVKDALRFEDDVVGHVRDVTAGSLCDVVIEATGQQAPLDIAGQIVRDQGRLVIVGYHQQSPRNVDMELWQRKGIQVLNAHERDRAEYLTGLRSAIDLVATEALDPGPLFTHRFALDDIGEGFATLEQRPEGFVKALVEI